ncbi:hypothetical protein F4804DRAFT_132379 [Jackrogersella minutella]|nr:hypothetical protein F4804DRAFT_132379 [Jackrogersella minutella]
MATPNIILDNMANSNSQRMASIAPSSQMNEDQLPGQAAEDTPCPTKISSISSPYDVQHTHSPSNNETPDEISSQNSDATASTSERDLPRESRFFEPSYYRPLIQHRDDHESRPREKSFPWYPSFDGVQTPCPQCMACRRHRSRSTEEGAYHEGENPPVPKESPPSTPEFQLLLNSPLSQEFYSERSAEATTSNAMTVDFMLNGPRRDVMSIAFILNQPE